MEETITNTLPSPARWEQERRPSLKEGPEGRDVMDHNNAIINNSSSSKNPEGHPSSTPSTAVVVAHEDDDDDLEAQKRSQKQSQQQSSYHNPHKHSSAPEVAVVESTIQSCFDENNVDSSSSKHVEKPKRVRVVSEPVFDSEVDDDDSMSVGSDPSHSSSTKRSSFPMWITTVLIVFLGAVTCGAFVGIGVSSANKDEVDQFERMSEDVVTQIQRAWEDYVTAASWIHGRCRGRNFTRSQFRQMYEYLVGSGLDFQAAQFDPNITRDEREAAEEEARQFYAQHYPYIDYRGIIGFETANSTTPEPRSEQDFYFPIHVSSSIVASKRNRRPVSSSPPFPHLAFRDVVHGASGR
jgi:hypothetical protein